MKARKKLRKKNSTQKLHKIALKTAGTLVYSTHPLETSPPPPPPLSRRGAFIELPAINAPFRDNWGGGAYLERVCPSPLPSRSRIPSIQDNPCLMNYIDITLLSLILTFSEHFSHCHYHVFVEVMFILRL